jgi:hypothetical protein
LIDQAFLLNPAVFKKLQKILFLGRIAFFFPCTFEQKHKTLEKVDKVEITA